MENFGLINIFLDQKRE